MLLDECIAAEGRRMYQVQLLGRGLSELSEIELLLPMKAIVRQDDECRAASAAGQGDELRRQLNLLREVKWW